jgi:ParB family transcriptional regulator, chromosome partitioning protein
VAKLKKEYNFFDNSNQAAEAEQELASAQNRIFELEQLNRQLQELSGNEVFSAVQGAKTLPISKIVRDPEQVRRWFDPEKLTSLTASIKAVGIRERLWVRPIANGQYKLIAGERRYRSAIAAELTEVPVEILEIDDDLALTLSLLENLQREDLNPVEEAEGILKLVAQKLQTSIEDAVSLLYKMKNHQEGAVRGNVSPNEQFQVIESVFSTVGRVSWMSFVRTRLPLLKLPQDVLERLHEGKLEYTKAMAIARVKDNEQRQDLLAEAIGDKLSLSQIKSLVAQKNVAQKKEVKPTQKASGLQQQFDQAYKAFKRSKIWDDPKRQRRLEKLLAELESLTATHSQS